MDSDTDSQPTIVRENARRVAIIGKKQSLLGPGDHLADCQHYTELLAEYIARQLKRKVRQNFSTIRYMEVAVGKPAVKRFFRRV
jgi:hypothetical protein